MWSGEASCPGAMGRRTSSRNEKHAQARRAPAIWNEIPLIFQYDLAMPPCPLSRRSFLPLSAMLPWALSVRASTSIPLGLELYSVRDELKKDPEGTVRAVAQMGYHGF